MWEKRENGHALYMTTLDGIAVSFEMNNTGPTSGRMFGKLQPLLGT